MSTVIKNQNDLKTWCKLNNRPDLLNEWDYDLNSPLKPSDVSKSSNKKYGWVCLKCGHEWIDSIGHRTGRNSVCPICYSQMRTSFPEQAIYYYVKSFYPDAINGDRSILDGKELDVYIPSINVAI